MGAFLMPKRRHHREPVRPLATDKAHRADLCQSHEAAGKDDKRHRNIVRSFRDPRQIEAALKRYAQSPDFRKFAEAVARKMITGLFRDMGRTWRQAAAAHGMGRELYQALMRELKQGTKEQQLDTLITDTTYCIVTLPEDIGKEVAKENLRRSGTMSGVLLYFNRSPLKGRHCLGKDHAAEAATQVIRSSE